MSLGWLGPFPAGLTTGFQSIGAASRNANRGYGAPQSFPAGLTQSYINIGAVQKNPNNAWVDTFSDSVTASDSLTSSAGYTNTFSDSVTANDTQAAVVNYHQTFLDSVTAADSVTASLAAVPTFSDAVTALDTFGAAMATSATFSESVTLSDSFVGGIGYTFTFSDTVTASDTMNGKMGVTATIADGISVSDSVIGGIGYMDFFSDNVTASDSFSATVSPSPNIILSGTLDFGYSYRIRHQISTFLNFSIFNTDDNFIKINLTNIVTSQPISIVSGVLSIYAPNSISSSAPVLSPAVVPLSSGFQFTIPHTDAINLVPGLYSWIAIVTTIDGTIHTVTCGDINLSTGIIKVMERP